MSNYLNKEMRAIVISLLGFAGYCEELAQQDNSTYAALRVALRICSDAACLVTDELLKDMPKEQVAHCVRQAKASELMVIPKSSPVAKKEYYVITADVLDRLLSEVISDCAFCTKVGDELNRCQRRKDLMDAGIIGREKGECAYQGV